MGFGLRLLLCNIYQTEMVENIYRHDEQGKFIRWQPLQIANRSWSYISPWLLVTQHWPQEPGKSDRGCGPRPNRGLVLAEVTNLDLRIWQDCGEFAAVCIYMVVPWCVWGVSWHVLVDSDVRMYVLLVRAAGTVSILHGSPSRSQPCRSMYIWSRHVYVGIRRMVSRGFESGYTHMFEVTNWDPDSRQGTSPKRRYRHIPCCTPNTIDPQ